MQQAEALVAAAAPGARTLEAGALQVAVWQLTDQLSEASPTNDAALNARAAALRSLASGRAIGGPITITHADAKGCAGRSAVPLRLTGRPGSTATLAVTGGTGVVAPGDGPLRRRRPRRRVAHVGHPPAGHGHREHRRRQPHPRRARQLGRQHPAGDDLPGALELHGLHDRDLRRLPGDPARHHPHGPDDPGRRRRTARTPPVTPFETPAKPRRTPRPRRRRRGAPTSRAPPSRVTKTGPATAVAGSTVTYTIRVRNRGTVALGGPRRRGRPARGHVARPDPVGIVAARRAPGVDAELAGRRQEQDPARSRCASTRTSPGAAATARRSPAPGSTPARATACTRITSTPRVIQPAVTA